MAPPPDNAPSPFPPPPPGREGWPWTTPAVPHAAAPAGLPRISVVVPSYNQGIYIEETIRSIVLQGYPDLELIVMDGGSTDGTRAVLEKYDPWIAHWQSARDGGQTGAIQAGFDRATGELVGWQNSDDYFLPGALLAAGGAAGADPGVDAVYGPVDYVDAGGRFLRHADVRAPSFLANMPYPCVLNQSLLVRRRLLAGGVRLDERITHCMDYDFLWKLLFAGARFAAVPGFRSGFRQHDDAKGVYQLRTCYREFFDYYARLYRDGRVPAAVRRALLGEMRASCRNDFGTGEFADFREKLGRGLRAAGPAFLTPGLALRAAAAALGPARIARWKARLRRSR